MKPKAKKYSSTFGTVMHFGYPAPGWVHIGRPLQSNGDGEAIIYEWANLRVPDLIELAACAQDATSEWAFADSGEYNPARVNRRSRLRERAWWAWIAVRRLYNGLRGRELIAHSGPNLRWTLAYNKGDEESRRLGQQMMNDSPLGMCRMEE